MPFTEKFRNFIIKLQNLPEQKKKIVLWTIVSVLAVIMGFFWIKGGINTFSELGQNLQSVKLETILPTNK